MLVPKNKYKNIHYKPRVDIEYALYGFLVGLVVGALIIGWTLVP